MKINTFNSEIQLNRLRVFQLEAAGWITNRYRRKTEFLPDRRDRQSAVSTITVKD